MIIGPKSPFGGTLSPIDFLGVGLEVKVAQAGVKTAAELLGKTGGSFLSKLLPQTTKTIAVTKTIIKGGPTASKFIKPVLFAGGVAGGLLLSKLLFGGTPQTMTPTQTTSAAPQTTAPQDQKATVKGGITNVRTDSPNITKTYTTTNTYSTVNQYGAGTIDSVTSPSVTPSVIGGDSIAQLLAAIQGQAQTQGQVLAPTQTATQTATGGQSWITYAIIGGVALLGLYMFINKKRR